MLPAEANPSAAVVHKRAARLRSGAGQSDAVVKARCGFCPEAGLTKMICSVCCAVLANAAVARSFAPYFGQLCDQGCAGASCVLQKTFT